MPSSKTRLCLKLGVHGCSKSVQNGVISLYDLVLSLYIFPLIISLQTAPPDQKSPRIISRLLTLAYESRICQQVRILVSFYKIACLNI